MWTLFWDMHSGGYLKQPPKHYIFIEAGKDEAERIFENLYSQSPHDIACDCCGENYAVYTGDTLEKITEYHRTKFVSSIETLEDFIKRKDVRVINVRTV